MHGRVRRGSLAALAIGLGLLTAGCGALSGTDAEGASAGTSGSPSASASPAPKPLDAAALLATTWPAEAHQLKASAAEVGRPAAVTSLSDPECGQFLALKDGASAPVVVTQGITFKRDTSRGGMIIAAYGSLAEARDAFARLRETRGVCPFFSDAGSPNAPVVTLVDRPAPAEGDEALAFALAVDVPGQRDTQTEEHVVARVGAVIIDFRKMSSGDKDYREVPTFFMSGQVTKLVQAQR
ncbi:hypothetical protein OG625_22860 [Streptomyces sp. NBC_01351]|uniref:hypothetical protein n=1 Tax=Streptomyces sp. NBC_01351 TaxID=2903833 RepID=UPI002E309853|nr:hypothetical protein [Streptomyces sp. NBC_01351]